MVWDLMPRLALEFAPGTGDLGEVFCVFFALSVAPFFGFLVGDAGSAFAADLPFTVGCFAITS